MTEHIQYLLMKELVKRTQKKDGFATVVLVNNVRKGFLAEFHKLGGIFRGELERKEENGDSQQ